MFKFKRLLAVATATTMIFSITACGSSTSSGGSSSSSSKKIKSVDSLADALEASSYYEQGAYSFKFTADMTGSTNISEDIAIKGLVSGKDFTTSIAFDYSDGYGTSINYSLDDIITMKNNILYLNVDSIMGLVDVDTDFGSFGLMLPEVENTDTSNIQTLMNGLVDAVFKDADVEQSGNTYTLVLKTADQYETLMKNAFTYLDENQEAIQKAVNDAVSGLSGAIDYDKYIDELAEYYKSDIISAAELLGMSLSEDDYDSYVAYLKTEVDEAMQNADDEFETEINLFENWDKVQEEFETFDWDEFEEEFADVEENVSATLSVTADTNAYLCSFSFVGSDEGEGTNYQMNVEYSFEASNTKISKPSNATTITEMIKYVMNNQDLMMELYDKLDSYVDIAEDLFDF